MKIINKFTNWIPYLYFITIAIYWFTDINRSEGISAYPILLLAIPFLWQIIRPNQKLNFYLGICFVCLSSYLILAYIVDIFAIPPMVLAKGIIVYSGVFVLLNFVMSAWIVRNSFKHNF